MVGSSFSGPVGSFVPKLWGSASKSSVAWLGVHLNVMLAIFCKCSCSIPVTISFPFLCFVLFSMNTFASTSFPYCSNVRVSFTFLTCCINNFLDHGGMSSTSGPISGHFLSRILGLTSFAGRSVVPISVNPALLSLS